MFQYRTLRKLSYPYRYIKVSKQLAIKKPHKIHSNIKKVRCEMPKFYIKKRNH